MASKAKGKKDAKAKTPVIPENWDHRVLVTGAAGQIGSELVVELRKRYGGKNIIAAVHKKPPTDEVKNGGPVEVVDVTDKKRLEEVIKQYKIDIIYHLASVLSGAGEVNPPLCWQTNLTSLQNVLDLARDLSTKETPLRVFWSSSIAAFGPSAPKEKAPQKAVLDPRTFYGVTKVSGELLCNYYYHRWGVDVRTIRYVGVLTTKSEAGVNVSDFAIDMPHHAVNKKPYNCYLTSTTRLPWIYMPDALDATIALMEAPIEKIKIRVGYNVQGCSFTPAELVSAIQKHEKDFKVKYTKQENDNRQGIADSVPSSLDDRNFRDDVGWSHKFGLNELVADMIKYLKEHPSEIKEKKIEDTPEETKKGSKDKAKSTQKEEVPQKKEAEKSKPKKKEESDNEEDDDEEEPKPKGGKKKEAEKSKPKTKEPSDNEDEEDDDDESQKKGQQELTPLQLEVKAERERKAKEEAALIAEKERLAKEQADKVKKEQALREKQKQEEREKRRRDKEEKDERRLEKKKERERREAEGEEPEEDDEEEEKGSKKKGGKKDEDVWEGAGRSGRDDRGARGKDKERDRERVANAKAAKARKQRAGLPQEEDAARKKASRQGGARGAGGRAGGRGRDDDDEEDDEEEEEEEAPKPKGKAGGGAKSAKKKEEDDEDEDDEVKQAPKKVTLPPVPAIRMKGLIQVLPYLYLGGEAAAGARDELKAQGITHIINCVSEQVENQFPKEFKYTNFPLADEHDANPSQYFDEAYDVISKVKNSNSQRVLVHCTTGNCVGATIVLAYMLMSSKNQEKHLPLSKALEFLSGKEPAIKPSDDFLGELVNLEKDLYDTVSIKLKRPGGGRGGRGGQRSHPRGKGRRGK